MRRVRIIHHQPHEAGTLVELVRSGGFEADYSPEGGSAIARAIRQRPPDIVLIDLSRLPSHGRNIAIWLRGNKPTRNIPIVFVNGEPEKVQGVREVIPDAAYTTMGRVNAALKAALRNAPKDPVIPVQMMERYKQRTAVEKLGIVAATSLGVIDAPRDYLTVLGDLPEDVDVTEEPAAPAAVTLWFAHDLDSLLASLRRLRALADKTKLWILWRKGSPNGLNQNSIRSATQEAGLVDYKICSVDSRWSAMLFARKKV